MLVDCGGCVFSTVGLYFSAFLATVAAALKDFWSNLTVSRSTAAGDVVVSQKVRDVERLQMLSLLQLNRSCLRCKQL